MTKKTEVKKITEDQLELVKKQQNKLGELLKSIGVLEVQKSNLKTLVKEVSEEIEKTKKELEEEYGAINIDLTSGEYTVIEKEEEVEVEKNDK
tara:strand:- start:2019 stop:2297 length:279 start_codon:yes stop_codon:yes gene_type:complete